MPNLNNASSIKTKAPAKINYYLEILAKDNSGYYVLHTVFQEIGLHDDIEIFLNRYKKDSVVFDNPWKIRINNRDNTVLHAIRLFKEKSGARTGIAVKVTKNIPVAAGLGGGSSDAAAVLKALNSNLKTGYSRAELALMAAEIGSDVPFFIYGGTAIGNGRGDLITPLKGIPKRKIILINPGFKISTKKAYSLLPKKLKLTKYIHIDIIKRSLIYNITDIIFNRFEEVILNSYPILKDIKKYLKKKYSKPSLLSGSGPSMFLFENNAGKASGICRELEEKFKCVTWYTKTK